MQSLTRLPSGIWMALLVLTTVLAFGALALRADSLIANLCEQGTSAIRNSADQVVMARRIQQRLHEVERRARWLMAFSEPDLKSSNERMAYDKARTLLGDALDDFRGSVADLDRNEMLLMADQMIEQDHLVHEQLLSMLAQTSHRSLDTAFSTLQSLAQRLASVASVGLEQAIKDLDHATAGQRQRLRVLAFLWGLLPVTLIAIYGWLQHKAIEKLTWDLRTGDRCPLKEPAESAVAPGLAGLVSAMKQHHQRHIEHHRADRTLVTNLLNALKRPTDTIGDTLEQLATETVGELNDAQEDLVKTEVAAAEALRRMIAECERYLSAIDETGTAPSVITHVDMRGVVEDVAASCRTAAESRGLRLNLSLETVTVVGEAQRLRAMVDGLVSNALSYSPDGAEINVILRAVGSRMKLEVEDDGPGLDDEEREHAFEPFFVGRAADARTCYAAGLRLTAVRECVLLHGGEIELADPRHPKRGTRFRVQLPLERHDPTHT